jgi:hypothetical protein
MSKKASNDRPLEDIVDSRMGSDSTRASAPHDGMRADREMEDRVITSDRELTETDRLEMFRMGMFNDALPDLPKIPGYKCTWLTTTNPRDTIQGRMRLGYEPVRPSDVPHMSGLEQLTMKGGQWDGFISCNEMLAFKLPVRLYEMYMKEAHHDAPAREDEKIVANFEALNGDAQSVGSRLVAGDGLQGIRDAARRREAIE